jgi:hypothetical protein
MRDTIDMAREAGMTGLEDGGLFDNFLVFEALVRADEREACAKVAETYREWDDTGMGISTAIRARGNT